MMNKPQGIEIKKIGNHLYAYRATTVWDRKLRKRRKVSKYLGKWVDGKIVKAAERRPGGVYELGNIALLWSILKESGLDKLLQKFFPDHRDEIILIAFNRVIDPQPLKSMGAWHGKTYLAKVIKPSASPKSLATCLREIGADWNAQRDFFNTLITADEKLVYDTSAIFSYSRNLNLAEFGKDFLLPHVNLLLAFSKTRKQPCYVRLVPGSVMDVKTLRVFTEEIRDKSAFLILDKGFLDRHNLGLLAEAGLNFILPLRRNSRMIDYGKRMSGWFIFRKRVIKYASYPHNSFQVYLFEDVLLRATEENEFYNLKAQGAPVTFHEEWAGRIALLSNARLRPQEAFLLYKSRDDIEKAFNVFKNMLRADTPHLRDEPSLRGYVFVTFVALFLYYRLLKKLVEAGLNRKMSVKDALLELSKVYAIEIGQREVLSEIPKKARVLADLLGLRLELFPKILPS
jgi:transposase